MHAEAQQRRRLLDGERLAGTGDGGRLAEAQPFLDDAGIRREEAGELVLRPERQRPAKSHDFALGVLVRLHPVERGVLFEREQRLSRVPHVEMARPRALDVRQFNARAGEPIPHDGKVSKCPGEL